MKNNNMNTKNKFINHFDIAGSFQVIPEAIRKKQ